MGPARRKALALSQNLGNLGRLPFEVRAKIWQHACHHVGYWRDSNLLTVSRQVGQEVVDAVNHGRHLHFLIRPNHATCAKPWDEDHPPHLWPSRFYVVDNRFMWPIVHPRFLHFDVFDTVPWFRRMARHSLSRGTSVRVAIRPPLPGDCGQLIMAWNKILWTVRFLATAKSLRSIMVDFVGDAGQWFPPGVPKQSLPGLEAFPQDNMELCLIPFQRLRRVGKFVVQFPKCNKSATEHVEKKARDVRSSIKRNRAFNPGRHADDLEFQRQEEACSACFEHLLDDSKGKTAGLLRLERMASLHKDYYQAALQRIESARHFLPSDVIQFMQRRLDDRLNAMHVWCIRSNKMGASIPRVTYIKRHIGFQLETAQARSGSTVQTRQKVKVLQTKLERAREEVRALEKRTNKSGRDGIQVALSPKDEELCPRLKY